MINFKGLANEIFYHLDAADRRRYRDYTGCGNTVNCNHPLVTRLHRALPRVLGRGDARGRLSLRPRERASRAARTAQLMADPPLPWAIESSRILARVPLIAEAWDAAGLYQVGAFPGMALGGVERPLPRRRAPLRARRAGPGRRGRDPHRRQQRPVRRRRPAARATASTSSPATTASRCTIW